MERLPISTFIDLNALGLLYHSGFGYYPDRYDEDYIDPNDTDITYLPMDKFSRLDADELTKYASENRILHKYVTLVTEGEWHGDKPKNVKRTMFDESDVVKRSAVPWYELPERKTKKGLKLVGSLSDRDYIKVERMYDIVSLSQDVKGDELTIDDILFASRALCIDATRSMSSYKVMFDDGETLKLLVDIDNFST